MKKRNRDIQIFNLSALDLFCSAMGAIMVLMVLLMPYYMRPKSDELVRVKGALEQARGQIENLRSQVDTMRSERDAAGRERDAAISKLGQPFLIVAISWGEGPRSSNEKPIGEGTDIDLHVVDPAGRHYYFPDTHRSHAGSPAKLEVDSTYGPGSEVWIHPAAAQGIYKIEYVYFGTKKSAEPVTVRGVVVHRDGREELPQKTLTVPSRDMRVPVCTVEVGAGGSVAIR